MIKGILKRLTAPKPQPLAHLDLIIARRAQRLSNRKPRRRGPMNECRRSWRGGRRSNHGLSENFSQGKRYGRIEHGSRDGGGVARLH